MTHSAAATRILAIPGSLRRASLNRALLAMAAKRAPETARIEVWDGLAGVEPFNEDDEHAPPPGVNALRSAVTDADAVLIATPEYSGAMPGQLKNALDWAARPQGAAVLVGKPVATASVSPTPYGGVWSQEQMRRSLELLGAVVVGDDLVVPDAYQRFDGEGQLTDETLLARLDELVAALVAHAVADRMSA
jgi:chromate reductase, NAD(P)H dehydrogenase (quinone)